MKKPKKKNYIYSKGRRREASARVRLHKGKGESTVNEKPAYEYFPGEVNKIFLDKPFNLTGTLGKYYFTARVSGGGLNGQLQAVILGLARSLAALDKENRVPLKKAGLLTRDGRTRERRKVGMGGKARRKKQSPKR